MHCDSLEEALIFNTNVNVEPKAFDSDVKVMIGDAEYIWENPEDVGVSGSSVAQ